jgi:hypothetical protein
LVENSIPGPSAKYACSRKASTTQIALSTILPFVVGLCATRVTLVIGEQYGSDTWPFVLVGWCLVLGVSAAWLNRVVFRRTNTLLPFLVAVVAILLVWLWQRRAFTLLVPHSSLTYGYFLTPEGAKARFWADQLEGHELKAKALFVGLCEAATTLRQGCLFSLHPQIQSSFILTS